MLKLKILSAHLNELLACSNFVDHCPNGIQVEGAEFISKIAVAVSADLEVIQKAIQKNVQALIVHHGIFWSKDPYEVVGTKKNKLKLLLENEISLLAYHLPLDAHREIGNNWKAAQELGFLNRAAFGKYNGTEIGVKGEIGSISIEKFVKNLEDYYGHPASCALGGKKTISNAAIISGGAWRELKAAVREGIDCFITGNFDEPAWSIAHEEKINFIAMGHNATEKIGPMALGSYLKEKFNVECDFIDTHNPF